LRLLGLFHQRVTVVACYLLVAFTCTPVALIFIWLLSLLLLFYLDRTGNGRKRIGEMAMALSLFITSMPTFVNHSRISLLSFSCCFQTMAKTISRPR
jgi:ABC-type dipeptide/oligopeptide/nickel transport system permease component